MQPPVASNSMFLGPLKPRKKNRALSEASKNFFSHSSSKDEANTSSGQYGEAQGTDGDTLHGTDTDTLDGTDTDTLTGASPEAHRSPKKHETLKRGILILRRWNK